MSKNKFPEAVVIGALLAGLTPVAAEAKVSKDSVARSAPTGAVSMSPVGATAEFSQPIKIHMTRPEAIAARGIERRILQGKTVAYGGELALAWKLPNSQHRFEYVTKTPITAKVQGKERFFTITAAKTIDGTCQDVTVEAIPKTATIILPNGPPVPPSYSQPPYVVTNHDVVHFDQNDPRPEVTLRYSNGQYDTTPLGQTIDIGSDSIVI